MFCEVVLNFEANKMPVNPNFCQETWIKCNAKSKTLLRSQYDILILPECSFLSKPSVIVSILLVGYMLQVREIGK